MERLITKFLFFGLLAVGCLVSRAQVKEVSEDEISINILKWHFHHYPQSTSNVWKVINDGKLFESDFIFEDKAYYVTYSAKGKVLTEVVDLSDEVPVALLAQLDEQYEKYKVNNFERITNFADETIFYKLEIKSKENGQEELNFDKDLIPINFNVLSKAN